MKSNFNKYLSLILIGFITISGITFADQFKNTVTRLDTYQALQGVLKINLYTQTPYQDTIVVNKKPENRYVILLPETSNSIAIKPSLNGVSDIISDIDIKTQPYSSLPGKGYTKITIDAKKPIEVVPQAYSFIPRPTTTSLKPPPPRPHGIPKVAPVQKLVKTTPAPEAEIVPKKIKPVIAVEKINETKLALNTPNKAVLKPQTQANSNVIIAKAEQPKTVETDTIVIDDSVLGQNEVDDTTTQKINPEVLNDIVSPTKPEEDVDEPLVKMHSTSLFQPLIDFKNNIVNSVKKLSKVKIEFSTVIMILQLILLIVLVKVITNLVKKIQTYPKQKSEDEESISPFVSYSKINEYTKQKPESLSETGKGFKKLTQESTEKPKTTYKVENNYSETIDELYKNNLSEKEEIAIFKNPLKEITEAEEKALFEEDITEESFSLPEPEPTIIENDEEIEIYEKDNSTELIEKKSEPLPQIKPTKVGLNVQSKYNFAPNIGLSLVDFKGKTALIGYIQDKIFVLKKYNKSINAPILVKLNERKSITTSVFLVKIEEDKMLVQLKPDDIKLLMNL